MNETVLEHIQRVSELQMESQLDIYMAMGDNLVKEFFIEEAIYQESELREDGRVPTLDRLSDWFKRFITRIQAYFVKRKIEKNIEKLLESDRYTSFENYQALIVDKDWYRDYVEASSRLMKLRANDYIGAEPAKIRNVIRNADFNNLVKDTDNVKHELKESYDDIKKMSAINDKIKKKNLSKNELDGFLGNVKKTVAKLSEEIKRAYDSIDNVKEICNWFSTNNLTLKGDMVRIKEQYVKLVTDYSRCLLYLAWIHDILIRRIKSSLGRVQSNQNDNI